ncbi:hypothetical protein FANTH_14026 [Fusarium anthophilum]|uniref:Uncharacterized protein n=1 Tax=Fusarium anthophilum TaxID=48485 RepID=A0A8H4YKN5_9HYPO|nr:hypothetical protein FANTH_14026 [Fusarium anthophilum]
MELGARGTNMTSMVQSISSLTKRAVHLEACYLVSLRSITTMYSWCFPHFNPEPVKQIEDVHRPSARVIPILLDHNGGQPKGIRDTGQRRGGAPSTTQRPRSDLIGETRARSTTAA